MKQFAFILIAALACAGCGYVVRHQVHFPEIERPVTAEEIVGRWVMWSNKLDYAIGDGFKPQTNQEFAITIRSNGTCSYHGLDHHMKEKSAVYAEVDGQWSLRHYPATNYFRNYLEFDFKNFALPPFHIGLGEKGTMLVYEYWGDPDDSKYIVYQKEESVAAPPDLQQPQH